jgi:hypothetical protein
MDIKDITGEMWTVTLSSDFGAYRGVRLFLFPMSDAGSGSLGVLSHASAEAERIAPHRIVCVAIF